MSSPRAPRENCPQVGDLRRCPCVEHRAQRSAHTSRINRLPKYVDEAMVQRLLYGPDPGANWAERRTAIEILLKRGQEESYRCIADRVGVDRRTVERVGVDRRTVERVAVRLGLSALRPRALVEIGACETRADLWQLLHRGHAPAGSARSLGISYSTAYGHVRKLRRIGVL